MNEKESMMHKATRKALDVMIRRTYDGWPPFSPCGVYQPHRPEKPLPKPRSPPSRPSHPVCGGRFLFQNFFVFNVKVYLTFGIYNFVRAKMRW